MVNYELGKIYQIVDNTNGNIYIGSTCERTLARRLSKHVRDYRRYLENKFNFITSYEIIKNNNYDIVLIEAYPCESKDELHARERFHIEKTNCVNLYIPTRTKKEYLDENRETINFKQREYWNNNLEKMHEIQKEYRANNIDKIKENKRIFRIQNKEKISEQDKKFRETHKEEIKLKHTAKETCECGSIISHIHIARHKRTKKHIDFINQLNHNEPLIL